MPQGIYIDPARPHAEEARAQARVLAAHKVDPAKIQKIVEAIQELGPGAIKLALALLDIATRN